MGETQSYPAEIYFLARDSTLEAFLARYDPDTMVDYQDELTGITALLGAASNKDPYTRINIANRLLDDGADASAVMPSDRLGVLSLLLRADNHPVDNVVAEAALLRRLLEGGADPNLRSPRWGPPLEALIDLRRMGDDNLEPYYDPFFSRPNLNFDVKLARSKMLVYELLSNTSVVLPKLHARFLDYIKQHPESVPASLREDS